MPGNIKLLALQKLQDRQQMILTLYDEQYPEDEHLEGGTILYRDPDCGYVVRSEVDFLSDWLFDNGCILHERVLLVQ